MYLDTISRMMTHAVPASGGSKGHTSEVIYIEKSVVSAVIRRDETIEKDKPQVAHCSHVASLAAASTDCCGPGLGAHLSP